VPRSREPVVTALEIPVSPGREQPGTGTAVPGWHLWRSESGRPHATRTGRHAHWARGSELPMTVDADTEAELLELLDGYREAH
jgi:hypothetical protein